MTAIPTNQTTSTRLTGPTLLLLRIGWILTALLIGGLLIYSIPYQYANIADNAQFAPEILSQVGLSTPLVAGYDVLLDLLTVGMAFFMAVLLFIRRPNERIALLTSLMLITWSSTTLTGMLYSLTDFTPAIEFPLDFIKAVGQALLIYFGYTFPTGKFNPKWTRWIAWVYGVWVILSVLLPSLPISQPSLPKRLSFVIELAIYIGAVVLQVYRFRRVLTREQLQQAKWVVYGMVAAILGFIAVAIPNLFITSLNEPGITSFWYEIFLQTFLLFSLTAIPVSMGLSILRYRLWDVDFIINRSLVYGILTLALGLLFWGLVLTFQGIMRSVTGGQQSGIALPAAATVIGFMFNPTRKRLSRFVDQRLYGIEIDYQRTKPQPASGLPSHTGETFGTRLGSYEIHEQLGAGGMSEVYLARQPLLNRHVALKMLNPGMVFDEQARQRFEREARALAALHHPNILEIYDYGEQDDIFYMVIEYIDGSDLEKLLREVGALSLEDACPLITQVASALDYAHGQGVIHRDVKPANVLLKRATGSIFWTPILSDFGIARLQAQSAQQMTRGPLGTVDYISPEQIRNLPDIDGRADVYSMGVMVFELLTGQLPFVKDNPGALLMAHMQQPPPNPRTLRPDLSDRTCAALIRAMAKEREHRYATAGEFAAALCA